MKPQTTYEAILIVRAALWRVLFEMCSDLSTLLSKAATQAIGRSIADSNRAEEMRIETPSNK